MPLYPTGLDREPSPPLLEARGVSVRFGDLVANHNVNISLHAGEVHAVLGENGAGKSTLMKVLYGINSVSSGELYARGELVQMESPADARALDIGMVFQDLRLIGALTVAENIALALGRGGASRALRNSVAEAADRMGLAVGADALVRTLSLAERQQVEILRVLMTGARVVILDEPTSALAPQEVDALFETVDRLRSDGLAVALITHKLAEARANANRLTVLRNGELIVQGAVPESMTDDELVEAMVGTTVRPLAGAPASATSDHALAVRDLSVQDDRGGKALNAIDMHVMAGEWVGVAGVAGSGQRELYEAILGLRHRKGTVAISGTITNAGDPRQARAAGAVGLSEDPVADEIVTGLNVLQTLSLGSPLPSRGLRVDWATVESNFEGRQELTALAVAPFERDVATLSGGNIQRVLYARALASPAKLLVLAYPSRGLDIATVRQGLEMLRARCLDGCGVLMISEDLDELLAVCDRIVVLHDGGMAASVSAEATDRRQLGQLMVGAGHE